MTTRAEQTFEAMAVAYRVAYRVATRTFERQWVTVDELVRSGVALPGRRRLAQEDAVRTACETMVRLNRATARLVWRETTRGHRILVRGYWIRGAAL